jgi:phenylpropionate dioxygenase-like ring-hydroxylating dioxygenase large terminal subunit
MMNEPEGFDFSQKIKLTAYPTVELGGLIWTYMGPPDRRPPEPDYEWARVPEAQRTLTKVVQECNWLQALEGGIDTSHAPIMHRRLREGVTLPGTAFTSEFVQAKAPVLELEETDYGYRYFGVRQLGSDRQYVRGYHFVMPFTQLRPPGLGLDEVHGHHWVPVDDDHVMVYNWYYAYGDAPLSEEALDPQVSGNSFTTDIDVTNGFRGVRNKSNDWGIDRQVQKTDTFTGIYGINTQDRAVQEAMGAIVDRSKEHLGQADRAIIVMRHLMQQAVDVVSDGGDPRGVGESERNLRAAECTLAAGDDWRAVLMPRMYPSSEDLIS